MPRRYCFVLALLLLAGCGGRDYEPPVPQIAVYRDRYEFRGESYPNLRTLHVGLSAASVDEVGVEVRECVGHQQLVELIAMLRGSGHQDVAVELPRDC